MSKVIDQEYLKKMTNLIKVSMTDAVLETNSFCKEKILTRGGRVGSGMGTLLEALWGFNVNQILLKDDTIDCEIAWFPDNDYNDFACVKKHEAWHPKSRRGELFRIEIKSMNRDADESKGHFDEIKENLGTSDLLVVLIWSWGCEDGVHSYPYIHDFFIGNAKKIAHLRDELHISRGSSFVDKSSCPDGCNPSDCKHHGEPLNAKGNRERSSGPIKRKPSGSSHASNFGGLVRMLKTSNDEMRRVLRKFRNNDVTAHEYISFIHRNFPLEELNQYTAQEWRKIAKDLDPSITISKKEELYNFVIKKDKNYKNSLRKL